MQVIGWRIGLGGSRYVIRWAALHIMQGLKRSKKLRNHVPRIRVQGTFALLHSRMCVCNARANAAFSVQTYIIFFDHGHDHIHPCIDDVSGSDHNTITPNLTLTGLCCDSTMQAAVASLLAVCLLISGATAGNLHHRM